MKYYEWNEEKNRKLKRERRISFEECLSAIESGRILDIIENKEKYPGQKVFILEIGNYAYLVPFVEDRKKIFLKTIIPSRKATKKYLRNKKQ